MVEFITNTFLLLIFSSHLECQISNKTMEELFAFYYSNSKIRYVDLMQLCSETISSARISDSKTLLALRSTRRWLCASNPTCPSSTTAKWTGTKTLSTSTRSASSTATAPSPAPSTSSLETPPPSSRIAPWWSENPSTTNNAS